MTTEVIETQSNAVAGSPDSFIQHAINSNAPVETLERLLVLKERHEASEAKKAYIAAIGRFQSIKPRLTRTKEVSFGQGKTAYKFCPLPEIEKALSGPLSECGLTYRFENLSREGQFGIRLIITHEQGHSETTEMFAPADNSGNKNAIQGIGSTSSYLMRYTLIAGFGLTTADDDDDGQSASETPYFRLLSQSEYLRDPDVLDWLSGVKRALATDDLEEACDYMMHAPTGAIDALWIAPSKGGVFTTDERAKLKSDEMGKIRRERVERQQKAQSR